MARTQFQIWCQLCFNDQEFSRCCGRKQLKCGSAANRHLGKKCFTAVAISVVNSGNVEHHQSSSSESSFFRSWFLSFFLLARNKSCFSSLFAAINRRPSDPMFHNTQSPISSVVWLPENERRTRERPDTRLVAFLSLHDEVFEFQKQAHSGVNFWLEGLWVCRWLRPLAPGEKYVWSHSVWAV